MKSAPAGKVPAAQPEPAPGDTRSRPRSRSHATTQADRDRQEGRSTDSGIACEEDHGR